MPRERLQKIVARAGIASRRAAEELIRSGRVRVNGSTVQALGTKVDARADKVEVDGRRLVAEAPFYIVLHKPRGVVSTVSDPEGRKTVRDLVQAAPGRAFPVGRLDYHTSGVLLLTNDGEFCDGLIHPKHDVPKTYVVKVQGEMKEADRLRWEQGVVVEGQEMRAADVFVLRREKGKTWLEVTLFEGRNQQIRKMGEQTGFPVMRLARTGFAGITAEGLRPGEYRPLTPSELVELKKRFGVPRRVSRTKAEGPAFERGGPSRQAKPARAYGARSTAKHESSGTKPDRRRGPSPDARRLTRRPPASRRKGGG